MNIIFVVVKVTVELRMFQVFLYAAFCTLVVDSEVECATISVEEGTDFLKYL